MNDLTKPANSFVIGSPLITDLKQGTILLYIRINGTKMQVILIAYLIIKKTIKVFELLHILNISHHIYIIKQKGKIVNEERKKKERKFLKISKKKNWQLPIFAFTIVGV